MDGSALNTVLSPSVLLPTAGAIAAVFVMLLVLALRRAGPGTVRLLLPIACLVVAGLAVGFLLDRMTRSEQAAERRGLQQRDLALAMQAAAPGSMLGCLDSAAGDTVDSACEKAVFADPQNVAAAVAYTAARLTLLADGLDYARRSEPDFAERFAGIRRAIELDRFGIAAHVLSSQDGCSAERCAAFALLRDTSALKANLRVSSYDDYVKRHANAWKREGPAPEREPVASAESSSSPVASDAAAPAAPPGRVATPVPSRFDFPSAASIPPVSIMNAEPPLPAAASAANTAAPPGEGGGAVPMPPPRPQAPLEAPAAR